MHNLLCYYRLRDINTPLYYYLVYFIYLIDITLPLKMAQTVVIRSFVLRGMRDVICDILLCALEYSHQCPFDCMTALEDLPTC